MFDFLFNNDKKIEKERDKLISDLENGDIEYLLKQMDSKEIFSPLLLRKRKKVTSLTDDISWYAYRRAETLNSDSFKEQLISKVTNDLDSSIKQHAYFCLAHLCKNLNDKELFIFLMNQLELEKNNDCKTVILIGIRDMDKTDLNVDPIKKIAKSRSSININAILALNLSNDSEIEDLLLELFDDTKDSHKKSMICSTLMTVGTQKSIPHLLAAYKRTRDYGLRSDIELAMKKID